MSEDLLTGAIPKEQLKAFIKAHLAGREPDLSTAVLIVASAFHAHKDRSGASYILHLQQVLLSGSQSAKKITVGVLHDLVEDTDWTLDDLREVGFSQVIRDAVDDLTHREGESYFDSIVRIGHSFARGDGNNLLSIDPKIEDLGHNLSGRRQRALMTESQQYKTQAYIVSYNYLLAIKKRDIKPGTSIAEFMEKRPELKDLGLLQRFGTSRSVGPTAPVLAGQAPRVG